METAIYALLSGVSALTALVATRIYPVQFPEEATYPAVRFTVVSVEQPSAMNDDPRTTGVHVQIDAAADSYGLAIQIRDAIRAGLVRYRGAAGGQTAQDILQEDVHAAYDDQTQLYLASVELALWLEG